MLANRPDDLLNAEQTAASVSARYLTARCSRHRADRRGRRRAARRARPQPARRGIRRRRASPTAHELLERVAAERCRTLLRHRHRPARRRRSRRLPGAARPRGRSPGPVPDRARCARPTGSAASVPAATTTSPSRSTSRRSWCGCRRCSAALAAGRAGPRGAGSSSTRRERHRPGAGAAVRSRRPSSGCWPRSPRGRAASAAAPS